MWHLGVAGEHLGVTVLAGPPLGDGPAH
jgi:hypothetical protein